MHVIAVANVFLVALKKKTTMTIVNDEGFKPPTMSQFAVEKYNSNN